MISTKNLNEGPFNFFMNVLDNLLQKDHRSILSWYQKYTEININKEHSYMSHAYYSYVSDIQSMH